MKPAATKSKNLPTEVRAKRTRALILKAGLDSILGGGISGFTANELMRRTGLSKGALFHHFKSLDEIAMECAVMAEHLVAVEGKEDFRKTLEHMMNIPYAFKRVKALGGILFFLCEKARDTAKYRKVMHRLNSLRCDSIRQMFIDFCPHLTKEENEAMTQYLHSAQLGLAGPAGECMGAGERAKVWEFTVNNVISLTAKK